MLREEQIRILKGLIGHLDAKTNVNAGGIMKTPADTYICEERFKNSLPGSGLCRYPPRPMLLRGGG